MILVLKKLLHLLVWIQKTFLGISDGVGGWSTSGHDPSLFSESLSYHSHLSTIRNPSIKPLSVVEKGYEGVLKDSGVGCGSATFCVVSLDSGGRLDGVKYVDRASNMDGIWLMGGCLKDSLGDSGFSVIRDKKIIFSSTSQTHYFNCPVSAQSIARGLDYTGS